MDDLKFIDTLDEDQRANLARVIDSANKHGVNPRLAAALAFTESQLRQMKGDKVLRGGAGEIGIMQIKPGTAKLMGYEINQILDPQANIDAGMKYLRQSIDKFGDPMLGAVGYNAGPDHQFFLGKGDPPKQSIDYVNRIKAYGGFDEPPATEEARPEETRPEEAQPPDEDLSAAEMGGMAGAGYGAYRMVAPEMLGGAPAADARAPSGPTSPGQKWASKVTGVMREGADTVVDAAQSYRRAMPSGKVTGPLAKKGFYGPGSLSIQSQPPAPGPLSRAVAATAPVLGAALNTPVARYGGAGASMAGSGAEFMERNKQGDVPGQFLSGAGTLGGALMMSKNPLALGLGAGLSISSPAGLAILDRIRKVRSEPTPAPATEEEMEEARKPFSRYPRP